MELSSFLRVRWEVFIIYWLSFFSINFLEFFIFNIQVLEQKDIGLLILLNLFISFLFSLILEILYITSKLISAIMLRLKSLWKYSIPSILIFFLFIFPIFDLTELKFSFQQLEGLKGSIFLSIYGGIILISIILILIFPLFYDLNGGFIIISSILSYQILKQIIFSYYETYPIYNFLILYYIFVILFYFFLQLRRRFSINVIYEKYFYPKWFIMILLFLLLLLLYLKFNIHSFVYTIIFTLLCYFVFINLSYSVLINIETKFDKNIILFPKYTFMIFLSFNFFLGLFLVSNINKLNFFNIYKTNNLTPIYFLEILHFINDKDLDGENSILGYDLDNMNSFVRSEGKFFLQNETFYINHFPDNNFDYYFQTLNFDKENPNLQDSFLSPSNEIDISLFSLLNQQSSFESYLVLSNKINKKYKSIFTNLTENHYRTICIGYDAEKNYFSINSKTRLDKGCEIFLPYKEAMDSNKLLQFKNSIEHYKLFLEFSQKQYLSYKTKKNFLWLHYDFSNIEIQENYIKDHFINEISQILDPKKNNVIIIVFFYTKPLPSYYIYTNLAHIGSLLNPELPYYSTLFRIIYFHEFQKIENFNSEISIAKINFFQNQFDFKKNKSLHHYVFMEPQDFYWKELIKIFKEPNLPPISILKKGKNEYLIYDGRFGFNSYKNFN